ncbi:MAG: hypothetical protein NTZ34_05520 [Chloroflexi bacterium]|nr:hypothetical protein [Chloroflexota bacterium]
MDLLLIYVDVVQQATAAISNKTLVRPSGKPRKFMAHIVSPGLCYQPDKVRHHWAIIYGNIS